MNEHQISVAEFAKLFPTCERLAECTFLQIKVIGQDVVIYWQSPPVEAPEPAAEPEPTPEPKKSRRSRSAKSQEGDEAEGAAE